MRGRLRDRRLTPKPRVTKAQFARGYLVERATLPVSPGVYRKAECRYATEFPEAIGIALAWAGPRETP